MIRPKSLADSCINLLINLLNKLYKSRFILQEIEQKLYIKKFKARSDKRERKLYKLYRKYIHLPFTKEIQIDKIYALTKILSDVNLKENPKIRAIFEKVILINKLEFIFIKSWLIHMPPYYINDIIIERLDNPKISSECLEYFIRFLINLPKLFTLKSYQKHLIDYVTDSIKFSKLTFKSHTMSEELLHIILNNNHLTMRLQYLDIFLPPRTDVPQTSNFAKTFPNYFPSTESSTPLMQKFDSKLHLLRVFNLINPPNGSDVNLKVLNVGRLNLQNINVAYKAFCRLHKQETNDVCRTDSKVHKDFTDFDQHTSTKRRKMEHNRLEFLIITELLISSHSNELTFLELDNLPEGSGPKCPNCFTPLILPPPTNSNANQITNFAGGGSNNQNVTNPITDTNMSSLTERNINDLNSYLIHSLRQDFNNNNVNNTNSFYTNRLSSMSESSYSGSTSLTSSFVNADGEDKPSTSNVKQPRTSSRNENEKTIDNIFSDTSDNNSSNCPSSNSSSDSCDDDRMMYKSLHSESKKVKSHTKSVIPKDSVDSSCKKDKLTRIDSTASEKCLHNTPKSPNTTTKSKKNKKKKKRFTSFDSGHNLPDKGSSTSASNVTQNLATNDSIGGNINDLNDNVVSNTQLNISDRYSPNFTLPHTLYGPQNNLQTQTSSTFTTESIANNYNSPLQTDHTLLPNNSEDIALQDKFDEPICPKLYGGNSNHSGHLRRIPKPSAIQQLRHMLGHRCTQSLKYLEIQNCDYLTPQDYGHLFSGFHHLTHLILYNAFSEDALTAICKLQGLEFLDISQSYEIEYTDPQAILDSIFQNLPRIKSLDLSGTNLPGHVVSECEFVDGIRKRTSYLSGFKYYDKTLDFLGLVNTANNACQCSNIPAIKVTGDGNEEQIFNSLETYTNRPEILQKSATDLFLLFRYSTIRDMGRALENVLKLMNPTYQCDKNVLIAASACLFYIIKTSVHRKELDNINSRFVINAILETMEMFPDEQNMVRNGLLTLLQFNIPEELLYALDRTVTILLTILIRRLGTTRDILHPTSSNIFNAASLINSPSSVLNSRPLPITESNPIDSNLANQDLNDNTNLLQSTNDTAINNLFTMDDDLFLYNTNSLITSNDQTNLLDDYDNNSLFYFNLLMMENEENVRRGAPNFRRDTYRNTEGAIRFIDENSGEEQPTDYDENENDDSMVENVLPENVISLENQIVQSGETLTQNDSPQTVITASPDIHNQTNSTNNILPQNQTNTANNTNNIIITTTNTTQNDNVNNNAPVQMLNNTNNNFINTTNNNNDMVVYRLDRLILRLSVSILNSIVCAINTEQKQRVGLHLGTIKVMLRIIRTRIDTATCDEILNVAWSTLWNITDETPDNCAWFLKLGGMDLFMLCIQKFNEKELYRNMLGLLGNVSEVKALRPYLMKDAYIQTFYDLLYNFIDGIEIAYNSAGILAHLLSDGTEAWSKSNITAVKRDDVLTRLPDTIDRWNMDSKRNINYRSLKPILNLLNHFDTPQVMHWAIWALANLTRVYPEKYCLLLYKEKGIPILKKIMQDNRPYSKIKTLATIILENFTKYFTGLSERRTSNLLARVLADPTNNSISINIEPSDNLMHTWNQTDIDPNEFESMEPDIELTDEMYEDGNDYETLNYYE